jgi:TolB-like protein
MGPRLFPRSPAALPLDSAPHTLQAARDLAATARPLLAVLPFTASSADDALRLLASEVAERLRERLAQDQAVRAILVSSEVFAGAPPQALDGICRELGVGHLIGGKCHGTGTQPSIYVELTDTRDWHIRWADFYGGGATALLAEDGEAMNHLVRELRGELRLHTHL